MTERPIIGKIASAALLTFFAAAGAHAQQFTFSTDFTGTAGQNISSNSGLSFVTGVDGSDPSINTAATAIVLTNLTTTSSSGSSDAFTSRPYSIAVSITNQNGGQTLTQTLTGSITGAASQTSGFFSNSFNQSSLVYNYANGDQFTVSNFTFLSPGAPGASTSGSIGAAVFYTASDLPEPGSLLLTGMGLMSMGGGVAIRRKRKATAAA